ncbi:MAG: chromate efflux transporter [Chloroflexota bacterium]
MTTVPAGATVNTGGGQLAPKPGSVAEVFVVATRLGLTCFGGPVAHLGYFRQEYVTRRQWIDEATYADLIALCQTLPGPASSQVGISIGILRAGLLGGLAAWLGFTLPSAIALVMFASVVHVFGPEASGWLHGLKVVAVAVVALAVRGMARSLASDRPRATIAIVAAIVTIAWSSAQLPIALGQVLIIAAAGVVGWRLLRTESGPVSPHVRVPIGRPTATAAWVTFFVLLLGLPVLRQVTSLQAVAVFDSFYRVGSLVFGGGHVVLPLLQAEVVPPAWVTNEQFLAGYGAAQAVPGPLFTFAAYLGAVMTLQPNGVAGAALALVAIYVPSFLMLIGTLPSWGALRRMPDIQAGLRGINAAVVGLLLAVLYQTAWTSAILNTNDFALALAAFGLLAVWSVPPWLVVLLTAAGGAVLARVA